MTITPIRTVRSREVCSCRAEENVDGCEMCQRFRCGRCYRWQSWDDGQDDDMPADCSSCWSRAHKEVAA
jgi:hypothetical protein